MNEELSILHKIFHIAGCFSIAYVIMDVILSVYVLKYFNVQRLKQMKQEGDE